MPSTTLYQPGDFVLMSFPYSGGSQTKIRPAMVVLDTGDDDIVVARVTTQIHRTTCDVLLTEWRSSGLLAPSVVRLHKLATLEKPLVQRTLGRLQAADRANIAVVLQRLFGKW